MNNLEKLRLNSNKLDSVPASIANMSNLEQIWLQNNQLVTLRSRKFGIGNRVHLCYPLPEDCGTAVAKGGVD